MASVPNMRLGPTARPGVSDQPGDQAEGDGFAQVLSTTITPAGEAETPPQDASAASEEKPATGGQTDTPIAQAEAILSLVALQATPVTTAKAGDVTVPTAIPSDAKSGAPTTVAPAPAAPAGAGAPAAATVLDPAALSAVPASPTVPSVIGAVAVPAGATPAPLPAATTTPTSSPSIPGQPASAPAGQPVPMAGVPPLVSGTAEPAGPAAGQSSLTPPAAGTAIPVPVTAASAAKAAMAAAAHDGPPLVAMQAAGSASPAAAKIATLARAKTATVDPAIAAASTPAAVPGSGTRETTRQPSLNIAAPKGDGVAVQAPPVQAATPAALPFSPTAPIDPAAVTTPAAVLPPSAAASEAMIERQLDLAADGEWLDQLARDIASTGGAEGKMRFRLDPEHLGSLRVELAQSERGTSIRLIVENEVARTILADAQPKLAAEARAQGVRIADAHVDLAGGQTGDPRRHEADRRGPQLRTARDASSQAEPERQSRTGSDRYA